METQPFAALSPHCLNQTSHSSPSDARLSLVTSAEAGSPQSFKKVPSRDLLFLLSEVATAARESSSPPRMRPAPARPAALKKKAAKPKRAPSQPPLSQEAKLRVLAMSFKLAPQPSEADLKSLAKRVGMGLPDLLEWFERRRRLEAWAGQHPQLTPSHISSALHRCQLTTSVHSGRGTRAQETRGDVSAALPPIAASSIS